MLKRRLRRTLSRLAAVFLGLKCDRCGRRGASLVIDAVKTNRVELDGGRRAVQDFEVRGVSSLCPRCRG